MLDAHAYVMQVKLCKANTRGVTPKPKCSKFAMGLQTEGRKMGGTRGPVRLWSEGPRVMGTPLCAECSSVCSRSKPDGSVAVC